MSESKGRKRARGDDGKMHWTVQRSERKGGRKGTHYRKSSGYADGWKHMMHLPVLGSLSPRCRMKMGYADTQRFGDATVTQSLAIYRLNSVWDPDYSGAGVTVTGYSTFAALYQRYFVHGSHVEVTAEIRDTSANTVNAVNTMVGCIVSDAVPATPVLGGYNTEILLERYKLANMPRGTTGGGIYRFNHNKLARSTVGNGIQGAGGNLNQWVTGASGPTSYYFTDKRDYHLDDPLATLNSGGFIEHEYEGEFPLTAAYNAVPVDGMFLGVFAFSLPEDNVAAPGKPLPYIYIKVNIIYDVEWYAPVGIPAPSTAPTGAGAGLDATLPLA